MRIIHEIDIQAIGMEFDARNCVGINNCLLVAILRKINRVAIIECGLHSTFAEVTAKDIKGQNLSSNRGSICAVISQ